MDRDAFEQLVSHWLDDPRDEELRAAVEVATAASPELERIRDEWVRLDQLVRGSAGAAEPVDWPRLRQRIGAQLTSHGAGLDAVLRGVTAVEQRVDWPRLRRRISQALDDGEDRVRVVRFPLGRAVAGMAFAAAAVLALMLLWTPESPTPAAGVAQVRVNPPAAARPTGGRAGGLARVTVNPLPETGEEAGSSRSEAAQPHVAEVFLMVEPIRVAANTRGRLNPLGFN
jgi:hypothetical protein